MINTSQYYIKKKKTHSAKPLREEFAVTIYYLTMQNPMFMPEVVSGYSESPILLDSRRRLNSQKSR